MRKAIIGLLVVGIFIGVLAFVASSNGPDDTKVESYSMHISEPTFEERGNYITVSIANSSFLMETGKPILPVLVKTFTFPAGTYIVNVNIEPHTKEYSLTKKIEPAPNPVPTIAPQKSIPMPVANQKPDEETYGSKNFYPSQPYSINIGAGLKNGEHVVFLNIRCYTQYSPATNKILIPDKVDMKIEYKLPDKTLFTADKYDLLIITDEKFLPQMKKLADFKNSTGINTIIETTQQIYPKYNGRDKPEDIKLAIKDAIEKWGIKYVLLGGGRRGQTFDWYIPERRSNNQAENPSSYISEGGYSTDLYYADIYEYQHGNFVFDDWDSNGNGIFAEWSYWGENKDIMDYYPDVYVGRLPFRYSWEADVVVDKIINYEKGGGAWFKRAFIAAGDTSPPARGAAQYGIYEGEIVGDVAAGYLESKGFSIDKLYTSKGTLRNYEDVVKEFNKGVGFAYLSGHGNPAVWGNFLPDAETEEEFVLGFSIFDIWKYDNGYQLPIVVVGGCHNAQFNITMQNFIPYNEKAVYFGDAYPTDGCSWMFLEEGGGSIASMGATGYGYGYINKYCTIGLGGWIEPRFFYEYANGDEYLGEAHGDAITDYINIIGGVNDDHHDRKTIEEWVLLGDPSLKIGGSGIGNETVRYEKDGIDNEDNGRHAASLPGNVPTWEKGMEWKYEISDVNFTLDEVKGRYIDMHLKTGTLDLKVMDVSQDSYTAEFVIPDADVNVNVHLDIGLEYPIVFSGHMTNVKINGNMKLDKSNMGIENINGILSGKIDLSSLPINFSFPPIIQKLLSYIPFVVTLNFNADFGGAYPIVDFPIDIGKSWGLPSINVTVDGTITSPWFRILNIINKFANIFGMQLLPPEIARLLPVIHIPDLLKIYNISNEIQIPQMMDPLYADIHPFKCYSIEETSVKAGEFNAYDIGMVRSIGQIWYSPDAKNIVKVKGNFNDILPIVKDFNMELSEYKS